MLQAQFTAYKTAEVLTSIFSKHHAFPRRIISARDCVFLSNFWMTVYKLHGITLRMSSVYHPETEGPKEIINRCLQE